MSLPVCGRTRLLDFARRAQTALDRQEQLRNLISLRVNGLLEKLEEAFDRLVTFVPSKGEI